MIYIQILNTTEQQILLTIDCTQHMHEYVHPKFILDLLCWWILFLRHIGYYTYILNSYSSKTIKF